MNQNPSRRTTKTLFSLHAKLQKNGKSHERGHLKTQMNLQRKHFGEP